MTQNVLHLPLFYIKHKTNVLPWKVDFFFYKNRKRRRINKWIVCLCFIEKRRNKTSRFPPVKTYSFSHPMRPHYKESYCIIFEFSQLKFDGLVNRLENCTFWCGHTKSLLLLMHQKWTIWCFGSFERYNLGRKLMKFDRLHLYTT